MSSPDLSLRDRNGYIERLHELISISLVPYMAPLLSGWINRQAELRRLQFRSGLILFMNVPDVLTGTEKEVI
jgi:hypothetical protein